MFRFTQGDSVVRRWVKVKREGQVVPILSCSSTLRMEATGVSYPVDAAIEGNSSDGLVRLTFSDFPEAGKARIELIVNGEHLEEPIEAYVRSAFERGPR